MSLKHLFVAIATLVSFTLTANDTAESLPVLKVTFQADKLVYEDYTRGQMVLENTDGTTVTLPAKFKTRGATALSYTMKPSFNMKLEDEKGEEIDSMLLGLRQASTFILDAMAIDRICMRNRVCFDIWNDFSRLPYETDFDSRNGTVGRFVNVYMNGQYKGIYVMTDKINRKLLGLKKPKENKDGTVTIRGVLYKHGTTDIGDQNTPGFFNDSTVYVARWHDAWELKEPDDYPGLAAWEPLVNYYTDNNFNKVAFIQNNFYVDNLIDYSLFVMAMSISDNWGNKNKYFSMVNWDGSGDDLRFIVTPWDLDTSLGGRWNGSAYGGDYTDWTPQQIANSVQSPFSVCFTNAMVKERMKQRWVDARKGVFAVDSVSKRLQDYCDLLVGSGAWSEYTSNWNKQSSRPLYVDDLQAEINLIKEWYADRFGKIDDYFGVVEADGIDKIYVDEDSEGPVYDLRGIRVDPDKLQPGHLYIQGSRKFRHR